MTPSWTSSLVDGLTDWKRCPRCAAKLVSGVCPRCNTDLRGPEGAELAEASETAVAALRARETLVAGLPYASRPAPTATPTAVPAAPVVFTPSPAPARPRSQVSLQSVLAVAGAGLFAIAAIVFTFLNPDLADFGTRTTIVAVVSVLFIGGAWLLARIRLQMSAEAVGALGIVFVGLDVSAVARALSPEVSLWTAAALATFVAAALLILVANLARIRTWLWAGLLGLTLVPSFAGYAAPDGWFTLYGHIGSGFVLVLILIGVRFAGARFTSDFRAERIAATALQLVVLWLLVVQLIAVQPPLGTDRTTASAVVLAVLALLAALSTRGVLPQLFAVVSGALLAAAGIVGALVAPWRDTEWVVVLPTFGGVLVVVVLAAALAVFRPTRSGSLRRLAFAGTVVVALLGASPTVLMLALQSFAPRTIVDYGLGLAVIVGLVVLSVGGAVVGLLAGWMAFARRAALAVALWAGLGVILGLAGWVGLLEVTRAAIGIAAPVAIALVVLLLARVASWVRVSLLLAAHGILLFTLLMTREASVFGVVTGFLVVAAILLLGRTVPVPARFVHTAAAFLLGLVLAVVGLDLAGLTLTEAFGTAAVLGVAVAAVATLVRALPAPHWYAILAVALVPVGIQVLLIVPERTGWATVVLLPAAALAALIAVWRRPGESGILRIAAAATVVPALAVVAVDAAAVHLDALVPLSGSPVALPVIAGIVALVLPTTTAIGRLLVRRGVDEDAARGVRLAVEVSALVTAGIAVPIAIARAAAGFETSFWVLAIVGLGGAATALFSARRYGWIIAAVSWTGALWSILALVGVVVLEPYLLPPALTAMLFGAIAVLRGRNARWFYAAGLATAAAPSLALLAVVVDPSPVQAAWRLWGLLGGAAILIALAALVRAERARPLRKPSLLVAGGAAFAGVVQALRFGVGVDDPGTASVIWPVIGLSALAAVLVAAAAVVLGRVSRYAFVPALAYLVVGALSATRTDLVETTWVLGGLMLAFLVLLVAIARLTRDGATWHPPIWVVFALAWGLGVAAWSPRALYVEWFSLPMALALLAAGALSAPGRATLDSWPHGWTGSWRRYGPGLVVAFLPSVLSTGTNPATWRAILVIALALAAILIGSRLRLAAPFLLGIAVLPIENIVVFAVQLGRQIETAPWWITLASAGIVLLALAVMSERKTAGGGLAARIRDLD